MADLTTITLEQDHSVTTTTTLGVYFAGLDTSLLGTWEIDSLYTRVGTEWVYLKTTSFEAGTYSTSDTYVFTGLSPNTTYRVYSKIRLVTEDDSYEQSVVSDFSTIDGDDSIYPDFTGVEIEATESYYSIELRLAYLDITGYEYGNFDIVWRIYNADDNPLEDAAIEMKDDVAYLGDRYSQGVKFENLNQNTEYYVEARIYYRYAGSREYDTIGDFYSTKTNTSVLPETDNIKIKETATAYETHIELYLDGLDTSFTGEWDFSWKIYKQGAASPFDSTEWSEDGGNPTSDIAYFYNLSRNTIYKIVVEIAYTTKSGVSGSITLSGNYSTGGSVIEDSYGGAENAYIVIDSYNQTVIRAYLAGLDTEYSDNDRSIWWYLNSINNGVYSEMTLNSGDSESSIQVFNYLSPGTTYTIIAVVHYVDADGNSCETNPFTISQTTTPSSGDTNIWECSFVGPYENISTKYNFSFSLSSGKVRCYYFSCMYDGVVTLYSEGSSDLIGYLSDNNSFEKTTGNPSSYLIKDDDSGVNSNFSMSYTVTKGKMYYLFVRCYSYSASTTESINIIIDPPKQLSRPALFLWKDGTDVKQSKQEFDITAAEWCDLIDNVRGVRLYLGLTGFDDGELSSGTSVMTKPQKGDSFTAIHYNQVLMAIAGAYGSNSGYYGTYAVSSDAPVTAESLNILVYLINNL